MRYLSLICFVLFSATSFAEITIRENSFQTTQPILRAERPFTMNAVIENTGQQSYQCRLIGPDGCVFSEEKKEPADSHGYATAYSWKGVCAKPEQAEFTLQILAGGEVIDSQTISQIVMPPRKIEKLPYIPDPKPVKTDMLIGAHNCPLWELERADLWNQVVKKHQERTPALGIYSQDNPELADWETKWAVEHGVSFFIYCWYRTSQGGPITTMFEQSAFDDALFKSRFGSQMKFTIMWENQRRGFAGITDEKDLVENLMPYWIEKFFKRDNYLKIDNKPVLFVYQPNDVSLDLGGDEQARKAFDLMREECKKAGFDGLILLGEHRGSDVNLLTRYKNMGMDYVFAYCWYIHYPPDSETIIASQMEQITRMHEKNHIIPQIVTLSQAWSGWRDEGSIWKLPPDDFETLLRKGKEFVEKNVSKDELGSRMMILDNWNEWSEGHYIAPYREYGFGYLDAVRRVFSDAPEEHEDLIPEDIGLGPYDMPKSLFENKTDWVYGNSDYDNWKRIFSRPQDWREMMGVKDLRIENHRLIFDTTTGDPAIFVWQDRSPAAAFRQLRIRLKTDSARDETLEFFWKTEDHPEYHLSRSANATIKPSGDVVEYVLPLREEIGWKGRVTELRLDPVMSSGVRVEIESIRLE